MNDAPLRIVHVTTYVHPDKFGGAERVVHGLAKAQAALGHQVTVLSGNHGGKPDHETLDGFELVRYPLTPGKRGFAFFSEVHGVARRAISVFRDEVDVFHAHQPASALAAIRLASASPRVRPLGVYSFYAPWAQERAVEAKPGLVETARNLLVRTLERRVLKDAGVLVALSRFSVDQITKISGIPSSDVHVIPPGVDARFRPGDRAAARRALDLDAPSPRPLLVTVRRLVKRMGLDDLLVAVKSAVTRGRDVALAIAGEGPERGALEALAKEIGVVDRVRFLGRVAEDRLPDLYRSADLFVLPTRALEGFGMATAEALASGTPVLATNVGATPELLARFAPSMAPIAPSGDSIAAGIERFLADREAWEVAARSSAARIASELTWEACARAVIAAYHSRLPFEQNAS